MVSALGMKPSGHRFESYNFQYHKGKFEFLNNALWFSETLKTEQSSFSNETLNFHVRQQLQMRVKQSTKPSDKLCQNTAGLSIEAVASTLCKRRNKDETDGAIYAQR